ncbi:MAG: M48 family metalloprotease [Smithellaceae bacterium]
MNRRSFRFGVLAVAGFLSMSCAAVDTVTSVATEVGVATGNITREQGDAIRTGTAAVAKGLEEFTPEQEYFIGRSVGAVILTRYQVLNDTRANAYVNLLGRTLAASSDMPELFAGYSFAVLDSNDINAFATPGGHVFITRGLLRCARTEDALAAVLAHEIGHIQLRHGMQAIKKARMTEALTILAQEGAKSFGGQEVAQLTKVFGGTISDITGTLVNSGYSRTFEYQADKAAVTLLDRVGYSPEALVDMLNIMNKQIRPGGNDFAKTHPSPLSRIAELKKNRLAPAGGNIPVIRTQRFTQAVGHLL